MKKIFKFLLCSTLTATLWAAKFSAAQEVPTQPSDAATPAVPTEQAAPATPAEATAPTTEADPRAQLAPPVAAKSLDPNEKTTVLNVKDADISSLVKTFSKLTRRNYIVDSNVKGRVTIHLPTPVTISEALKIFDSVLLLKGFTTVPVGDNIWKVVPAKDAKQTTIPIMSGDEEETTDALVTQLVRLKYVKAEDMQQLLQGFVSHDGAITAFSGTNSLILIDSSANIHRLRKLTEELDIPPTDQEITIIPVAHADAKDVAEKINEILGGDSENKNAQPNVNRQLGGLNPIRQLGTPTPGTPDSVHGSALPIKVIPDSRTNSIIVVADEEMTAKVRGLIEQLDSTIDNSSGRFYVYRLKHADSEVVADILNQLITGSSSGASSRKEPSVGSTLTRSTRSNALANGSNSNAGRAAAAERITQALQQRGFTRPGASGEAQGNVSFEGEVSIAADPSTNSLIINAGKGDYGKVKEVIEAIDVKRSQVLVEATILEVSINKNEGVGVELQGTIGNPEGGIVGQTNYGGLTNLLTNPAALTDLTIAAASSGTLTLPGGLTIPSQAVLISAVSKNSNVNVLSSPTILATDNEEAEIIVGENVPFVTGSSRDPSNLNNTFNQIERQDVGITLRITPQISTGDFVVLKIFVEISNVVAATRNDTNGPTTTVRTTETTVEVRDSQMVVTGGLISDNVTQSTRGMPYIQDIPIIGNLFKRDDLDQRRTNLLIFITPRIMRDQFDARDKTKDLGRKLEQEIKSHDLEPTREDVLHQPALDKVAAEAQDSELPGPMAPSDDNSLDPKEKAALDRTQDRLRRMLGGDEPEKKDSNVGTSGRTKTKKPPINVSIRPKSPVKSNTFTRTEPRGRLAPQAAITPPVTGETPALVVLKTTGANPKFVGLTLPRTIAAAAAAHFVAGTKYQQVPGGEPYVCLGKYSSISEATFLHPQLQTDGIWRELGIDAAALGQKEWLRK